MPTLVSKFGGSSTANAGCFRRVLDILRASPARRCAVLSAPGTDGAHREKVTALLAACWRRREEAAVQKVAQRFQEIASGLGVAGFGAIARREIEAALNVSEAQTVSRGEYLCAKLFSIFSGIPMADAKEIVRFDDSGKSDVEATLARFGELGKEYGRVIVPGFYGGDADGNIHLFPRNGSDITGALAAAGMGAGLYENWTDVPGLMTADPALVPGARLIPQVSYRQMRALSRAGARVLHPACLDPVALAGIPTRLRGTMDPSSFGTLIDERVAGVAPCIAGRKDAEPEGFPGKRGRISVFGIPPEKVLAAARELKVLLVEVQADSVVITVDSDDYEDAVMFLHGRLIG